MNENVHVTLVGSDQAVLVREIALAAFEEYRETLLPPPGILRESVEDVAAYIERGGAVLAFADQVAVGAARFHPEPGYLYIGRVAVYPSYRRRGIAGQIMTFLEAHAVGLGLSETRVEVRMALPSNVALYESLGYKPISIQPHPNVPEAMTVKMGKHLIV